MNTVVIDAATREKLLAANGTVWLTDESGTVVGEFHRNIDLSQYEVLGRVFTDAEIELHLANPKRYTAAEVEQRLRELQK